MDKNEALQVIRSNYPTDRNQLCEALETLIPELKESEDEKIRKSLIKSYTNQHPANFPTVDGFTREQIIAWLEKQKEVVEEYEDKLDRCACESFDKGYKASTEKIDAIENFDTEFEKQVSHLIASAINKEHEYNEGFVKWTANALLNYAKQELEKQGEQSIYDVPSRNMILSVWELGNEWKELTNGSISKEYGTQLEYIQKHWNESQYYLRDKQGEQKPAAKIEPKFKKE